MILILFRHGIAANVDLFQNDEERPLTDKGKQQLRASLPGLQQLLVSDGRPAIWTSPLLRAAETADILASGLKAETPRRVPAIAAGSWTELNRLLEKADPQQPVVLVGHEPTLGLWAKQLCGSWLPFKKGAAAAINLTGTRLSQGNLLWFVQPKTMRQLGRLPLEEASF